MSPVVLLICLKNLQTESKIMRFGAQGHILDLFLLDLAKC